MADTSVQIDLDPKKFMQGLQQMSQEVKTLAETIDKAMAKSADDIKGLEDEAEKGSSKISTFFRNLGTRVKEDLKTAFNVTGIMASFNIASQIAEGTKQALEMEKAFGRLNSRLKLSGEQLTAFKNSVGQRVASTGSSLEQIAPGLDKVAGKGNIKDTRVLGDIAEVLGQVRTATGEDVGGIADAAIETIKNQGQTVNAENFKKTMDSILGARGQGGFSSAGQAASALQSISGSISPEQAKKMGLGTRELAGLASVASRGGEHGEDILKAMLQKATSAGGQTFLNSVLGQNVFEKGKFNMQNFSKVDKHRMGANSEQALSAALGTDQADLSRFFDSMKEGMETYKNVVQGSNETADSFKMASDNLATQIDTFKESAKEAGREMIGGIMSMGHHLLGGDFKSLGKDASGLGKSAWENKGVLAGTLGLATGAALLGGGGIRGLLGGQAAKAAGIEPVYVTNAAEIGEKTGIGGLLGKLGGGAGLMGKLATGASMAGGSLAAVTGGYAAGSALREIPEVAMVADSFVDKIFDAIYGKGFSESENGITKQDQAQLDSMKKAVAEGVVDGHVKAKAGQRVNYTNSSKMPPTGGSM